MRTHIYPKAERCVAVAAGYVESQARVLWKKGKRDPPPQAAGYAERQVRMLWNQRNMSERLSPIVVCVCVCARAHVCV